MKTKLQKVIFMLSKCFIYGLIVQSFFLNFLMANDGNAQRYKSIREVYVVLESERSSVPDLLKAIEKGSQFKFSYDAKDIDDRVIINVPRGKNSVATILSRVVSSTTLGFKQVNNDINVKKVHKKTGAAKIEIAIDKQVSGRVTDKDGGPLPGVTVLMKGTNKGTSTDTEGYYKLTVPDNVTTLVFSFIGYISEEVTIGNRSSIDVVMLPDVQKLTEVVVIGYGTQQARNVTSAISSVKSKDLREVPVPGLDQALQGRAAGVQVTKNTGSPGGGVSIRIRGTSSLLSGQEPLYIVDGIPINNTPTGSADPFAQSAGDGRGQAGNEFINALSGISTDDIESIEILKDAASASIYGARAANGVVIITTKRGVAGKPQVSVNAYSGVGYLPGNNRYKLLEAEQFAALTNEGRIRNGLPPIYTENPPTSTNWQDEIFRTAPIHNLNLSVRGGGEKTLYSVSAGYFNQEGIMLNSSFERFTLKTNMDFNLGEKVKLGTNLLLSRSLSDRLRNNGNASGGDAFNNNNIYGPSLLSSALRANPTLPVFTEGGAFQQDTLNGVNNPVALAGAQELLTRTNRLIASVFLEWQIMEGLLFRTNWGVDIRDEFGENATLPTPGVARGGSLMNSSFNENLWLTENYLSYDIPLGGEHKLNTLVGLSLQSSESRGFVVQVNEIDKNQLRSINSGVFQRLAPQGFQDFGIISYFARAIYSFRDKYLLSGTVRRDGSSRFGPERRYGTFPSVSAGWIISEEPFMQSMNILSNLKLRASYGITGNDQLGDTWEWRGTGGPPPDVTGNYLGETLLQPNSIDNRDFTWETTEQFDIGLDLSLFSNRINLAADYYIKTTDDLLFRLELPHTTGFETRIGNLGSIENRGLELSVNSTNINTDEFSWTTNFNISFNRNKVLELANGGNDFTTGDFGRLSLAREGEEISFQAIIIDGINPETGDWLPRNIMDEDENDPRIDENDLVIVGSPLPDHFGGLSNTFTYKNFDLSVFLQWSYGNDIVNNTRSFVESVSVSTAVGLTTSNMRQEAYFNRWKGPGDTGATFRGIDFNNQYRAVRNQPIDRFIEDGSYLRVKNLTLGYRLPKHLLDRWNIQSARVYATANNLLTITDYSGYDPEVNHNNVGANVAVGYDNGTYPQATNIIFGVNLNF